MSHAHRHCHFCGAAYEDTERYPRACSECGAMVWDNPIPVAVVLVPVRDGEREGLLVIRRGIDPGAGKLALVGGFCEAHETWQESGARELEEETGVALDPATLESFGFVSTAPRPNRVLLFASAPTLEAADLPAFDPTSETEARGLVFGPDGLDEVFAFPLHVEAVRRWMSARGWAGAHGFAPV